MGSRTRTAVSGILCGALGVGVGLLVAGILGVVGPTDAVGSEVIDRSPLWLTRWAIDTFGTADKFVLRLGVHVVLALFAIGLAAQARRRGWATITGSAVIALLGALAATSRPGESWPAALPSFVGAGCSAASMILLARAAPPAPSPSSNTPTDDVTPAPAEASPTVAAGGVDRRRFLFATGGIGIAAIGTSATGVALERDRVDDLRRQSERPLPATRPVDVRTPAGAQLFDSTPFLTPVDDFYRIDTALRFPEVDLESWRLDIAGMVDTPMQLTYDALLALPQVERTITICCVSNEVGGKLIGNAVWTGVLLADLLAEVGVRSSAQQVFSTSLDGWTCGFPVEAALDGRDAMIAVGMNGQSLSLEHGFPARLVVPGLYGYVSATKWLTRIDLTDWSDEGYWIPLGWAREAPVKLQSRIDVPRRNAELAPGPQPIAGVAWAQQRGIARVEVRIDDGEWAEARLATDVNDDTWRQWMIEWEATPGSHLIEVRATDKDGVVQTDETTSPFPNGADGHHRIRVEVAS